MKIIYKEPKNRPIESIVFNEYASGYHEVVSVVDDYVAIDTAKGCNKAKIALRNIQKLIDALILIRDNQ